MYREGIKILSKSDEKWSDFTISKAICGNEKTNPASNGKFRARGMAG